MPLLIDHFLRLFSKRHHKTIKGVSAMARRRLLAFDWPGNVRQLRNVIESMVVVDADGVLDLDDLPDELAGAAAAPAAASADDLGGLVGNPLAEVERLFIAKTLEKTGGNRESAAEMLGIGQRTLYRKIKEYDL